MTSLREAAVRHHLRAGLGLDAIAVRLGLPLAVVEAVSRRLGLSDPSPAASLGDSHCTAADDRGSAEPPPEEPPLDDGGTAEAPEDESVGACIAASDAPRPRRMSVHPVRGSKEKLRLGRFLFPERLPPLPMRSACGQLSRPCPHVRCKHHLFLDVNPATGTIKFNYPDLEVWEMRDSCALDVADRGGATLEEIGELLQVTRERVRQIEVRGRCLLREALGDDDVEILHGGARA